MGLCGRAPGYPLYDEKVNPVLVRRRRHPGAQGPPSPAPQSPKSAPAVTLRRFVNFAARILGSVNAGRRGRIAQRMRNRPAGSAFDRVAYREAASNILR